MDEDSLPAWNGRDIAELLGLRRIAANRFRSRCAERNEHGRIYGGQMLGQALNAAAETIPSDRSASCMQFLFASGGIPEQAIEYAVTTVQEGKRFSSRNVRGTQSNGRVVCDASVTFAQTIESPTHQAPPPPDCGLDQDPERSTRLEDIDSSEARDVARTLDIFYQRHVAIDIRAPFLEDFSPSVIKEARVRFWIKMRTPMGDDPRHHAAAFAYLSDYWINFVASITHVAALAKANAPLYVASLNHAMWLHRPLRVDQWLLFDCVSPSGAAGRGLSTARVYSRTDDLVASAAQECLLAPIA
jgi:acyl-CoA thioesterase-2